MDFRGGRITIARQTLSNPDFGVFPPDAITPPDWGKYAAVSAYPETNSFFWPPGGRVAKTVRMEVYSHGSASQGIYQYLWGGGASVGNPEFYKLASPGCHTARFSMWLYRPDSSNAPSSGTVYTQLINVAPNNGGNEVSPVVTSMAGWFWLRTGTTHWEADATDVDTMDWYVRVSKNDYTDDGTFWIAQPRLWLDEITLDVQWNAGELGQALGWRYKSAGGMVHQRHLGPRGRWRLPVIDVSSQNAHRLNDWWAEGAPLVMTFQSSVDLADYTPTPENDAIYYGEKLIPQTASHSPVKSIPLPFHDVILSGSKPPINKLDGMQLGVSFKGILDLRTLEGGHPRVNGGLL